MIVNDERETMKIVVKSAKMKRDLKIALLSLSDCEKYVLKLLWIDRKDLLNFCAENEEKYLEVYVCSFSSAI